MNKTVYPSTKNIKCPRCGNITKHILYDYEYAIYKCTKCGNIHS